MARHQTFGNAMLEHMVSPRVFKGYAFEKVLLSWYLTWTRNHMMPYVHVDSASEKN
jgi:hypothetical protein